MVYVRGIVNCGTLPSNYEFRIAQNYNWTWNIRLFGLSSKDEV